MAAGDFPAADTRGRPLRDLRISVTDRYQFRCTYCMPREIFGRDFVFLPREQLLTFEELARLGRVFAGLGVRKLRLTGGEPLLRRDLDKLVAMLAGIDGVQDIALTTNGALLAGKARALAAAGLRRVTVSLDSLDDAVFMALNDAGFPVARVLEAIAGAGEAGMAAAPRPFCRGGTRARRRAEGQLPPCVLPAAGPELRGPRRAGASDQALREQIRPIWARGADRYSERRTRHTSRTQRVKPKLEMSRIGG